ncbi:hypothetical protein ACYFX5_11780 [Bremerella sp. T1]|uniref:hypothetical protein n=1 Tax=Bremerella sp. TYQ1 TaxID=3119568 RepID=UPI001CCC0F3C|nr:hypothetical protein [Bremerella volcania]UBM33752.1 hypothetical protein LA756_13725 [Bremerella volcania]
MLNERHLATIRAALRYWHDEMASHDHTLSKPYFQELDAEPLNPEEVSELIRTLESTTIRPVVIDARTGQMIDNSARVCQEEDESPGNAEQPLEAALLFKAKPKD